jgi:hypothetical protein
MLAREEGHNCSLPAQMVGYLMVSKKVALQEKQRLL